MDQPEAASKIFSLSPQADIAGLVPEAASQNLTHYGDSVKNFKFLKEVKILSNFVRVNWHAQCQFTSAEGTPRKGRRLGRKRKIYIPLSALSVFCASLSLMRSIAKPA